MHFRVIFVMDLLDGAVVHAKRGERERYKPIHTFSSVSTSSDPIQIVDQFKPEEVYVADLNRLMNNGDNRALLRKLRNRYGAMKIMLDHGIKSFGELRAAFEAELADCFVLGTETISLEMIEAATRSDMPVSVSIDLLHKAVLTRDTRLKLDPLELLKTLNDYPVQDIIVPLRSQSIVSSVVAALKTMKILLYWRKKE